MPYSIDLILTVTEMRRAVFDIFREKPIRNTGKAHPAESRAGFFISEQSGSITSPS